MFEAINNFIANAMDYVLGWVLYLPRDGRLVLIAVLTSAIMAFVRIWTTDQEWLGRAAADRKRLGQLIKQARRDRDKAAKKRHKNTLQLIKFKAMKYEGKPLLVAIVPVLLLATWAFSRLGFEPIRRGQEFEVRLFAPASAVGEFPHLLPAEGIQADRWVQRIVPDTPAVYEGWWDKAVNGKLGSYIPWFEHPPLGGVAKWKLRANGSSERYLLRFSYAGGIYEKQLRVGRRFYASAFRAYADGPVQGIQIVMQPVRLGGAIGGIDWLFCPGWLLAYLLIALPFIGVIKRLCRIH